MDAYGDLVEMRRSGVMSSIKRGVVEAIVRRAYPARSGTDIKKLVLAWSSDNPETLVRLAGMDNYPVEDALLYRDDLPREALSRIISGKNELAKRIGVARKDADPELLARAAQDKAHILARYEAISNTATPPRAAIEAQEEGSGNEIVKDAIEKRLENMVRR